MAYQRTEYHREEDRDNNKGGWRSWFGLDNKDRDEDRGYQYQNTTTYRNDRPYGQQYDRNVQYSRDSNYPVTGDRNYTGGYSGVRGGYGYQTADECSRPQYGVSDRYESRPQQDRDYYRSETRTYGGERPYTAGGDYSSRFGQSGDRDNVRGYGYSGEFSGRQSSYAKPDFGNVEYSRTQYGGDRDTSRSYVNRPEFGNNDYSYSRTQYGGDRDTSRGYGFSGDYSSSRQQYGDSSYPRSGYQSQSYSGRF